MNRRTWLALLACFALVITSCAPREGDDIGSPIFNGTTPDGEIVEPVITTLPAPTVSAIRVPVDEFSIQAAVDRALPGDLILVDPGVYTEEVVVSTPDVVIRGRDRNTVFIDGIHALSTGVRVTANGVAIENLTVRNYLGDAITVGDPAEGNPIDSFRALHITTSNTAQNGIALSNVTNAEVTQGWLSGHGNAGVLVSNCVQCNTLVTATLAEFSARGFAVVGASEGVSITSVTSRNNRVGIVVEDGASLATTGVTVAASVVQNNGFSQSPVANPAFDNSFGVGIHVGGSASTSVVANRITGNTMAAVLLGQNVDNASGNPTGTLVERNLITDNRTSDIVVAFTGALPDAALCIRDNGDASITPSEAIQAASCGASTTPAPDFAWVPGTQDSIPYENGPVPPEIDGLVDADATPPVPAGPVILPDPTLAEVPAG